VDADDKTQRDAPSDDVAGNQDVPSGDEDKQPSPGDEEALAEIEKYAKDVADKKHSELDKRLHEAEKKIEERDKTISELQGSLSNRDVEKLESDKKADLEAAGDDTERRKQVEGKYSLLSEIRDLTAQRDKLKTEVADIYDVMERYQLENRNRKLNELCKQNEVDEAKVKKFFKSVLEGIDTPEEIEKWFNEMLEDLPKVNEDEGGKPLPDSLKTTPAGSLKGKTPDELAEMAYSGKK